RDDVSSLSDELQTPQGRRADMAMKSRAHQDEKYRLGPPAMSASGRRSVPLAGEASPVGVAGSNVARFTQSVLISSSMARTAPARMRRSARSVMLRLGPPT